MTKKVQKSDLSTVGIIIGIAGIILAVLLGVRNTQLESTQKQIRDYAKTIKQNYEYEKVPDIIRYQIDKIEKLSK